MKKRRAWKKHFEKFFSDLTKKILEYYPNDQYYHSSEHIVTMLKYAKKIADIAKKEFPELHESLESPEFVYSILMHDIIYQTGKNDNEEKSAEFAIEFAKNLWKVDEEFVREMILSTKDGAELDCIEKKILHDLDWIRFTDLDACKTALYKLQNEALRDGYTKEQFFVGSLNFYNELLKKEKIFVSPLFDQFNPGTKFIIEETIKYLYENFC